MEIDLTKYNIVHTYKLQGNGKHSWREGYINKITGEEEFAHMIYEKPDNFFFNVEEAKVFMNNKIDSKTQELIFNGFNFDGHLWSLSITAQINWSNIPNLPEIFFPLPMQDKNGNSYSLSYTNRMNFYLTAVGAKNAPIQSGNALKLQINTLETMDEVLNFIDPR